MTDKVTEVLARAWIECDPNRAGNPLGSGFHPDDIIGQAAEGSKSNGGSVTYRDTPLTGKPRWHWFIPRAEKLASYLAEQGYQIVPR